MPWHRRASRRHTEGHRVAQYHMNSYAGGLDALASEGIEATHPRTHRSPHQRGVQRGGPLSGVPRPHPEAHRPRRGRLDEVRAAPRLRAPQPTTRKEAALAQSAKQATHTYTRTHAHTHRHARTHSRTRVRTSPPPPPPPPPLPPAHAPPRTRAHAKTVSPQPKTGVKPDTDLSVADRCDSPLKTAFGFCHASRWLLSTRPGGGWWGELRTTML